MGHTCFNDMVKLYVRKAIQKDEFAFPGGRKGKKPLCDFVCPF